MILWWLVGALAAQDLQAQLHALTRQKHACDDRIPVLDAQLRANPLDPLARLERADCLYQIGRLDLALDDVEAIPSPDSEAVLLQAVLLARLGRTRDSVRVARRLPSNTAARTRADAVLAMTRDEQAHAWTLADEALERWPDALHTQRLAGELAAMDPAGVTPAAQRSLDRPTLFGEAYNRGVNALNAGDATRCLTQVAEADPLTGPKEEPVLARLGHQCAALSGDLTLARAWLDRVGEPAAADPDAVLRHAELMRRSNQDAEAVLLFQAAAVVSPEQKLLRDTALVTLHTQNSRLDDGLAVSREGHASGVSQANLAVALRKDGRQQEAVQLLEEACRAMTGEDAVLCYQTVVRWRD